MKLYFQRLFPGYILDRGRQYYKDRRVSELRRSGDTYTATVRGTRRYYVGVRIGTDGDGVKITGLSCSCPYGQLCKHMAAVLYAIEDTEDKPEEFINPFEHTATDNDYFDFKKITQNLKCTEAELEAGDELLKLKNTQFDKVESGFFEDPYGRYMRRTFTAVFGIKTVYAGRPAAARIELTADSIDSSECDCKKCSENWEYRNGESKRLCPTRVALLKYIERYLAENELGSNTNISGKQLIDGFTKAFMQPAQFNFNDAVDVDYIKHDVRLVPRLSLVDDGGSLCVQYRIGTDKTYIVRKFDTLLNAVNSHGVYQATPKKSIDFAAHAFDDESERAFDFIRTTINSIDFYNQQYNASNYYGRYYSASVSETTPNGNINLIQGRLDQVFDMYKGSKVESSIPQFPQLELSEAPTMLDALITPLLRKKKFMGITVTFNLGHYFKGLTCNYYLYGGVLSRVDEKVDGILERLHAIASNEVVIDKKQVNQFYKNILPMLKQCVRFEDKAIGSLVELLAPDALIQFRLDASDQYIECEICAVYDDMEYNILAQPAKGDALRDSLAETRAVSTASNIFHIVPERPNMMVLENTDDNVFELLDHGMAHLHEIGEVHVTDSFGRLKVRRTVVVQAGVSVSGDMLDLKLTSQDIDPAELADLLRSYQQKKRYHRLRSGEYVDLRKANIGELDTLLDAAHVSLRELAKGNMHLPLYRALYLDELLKSHGDIVAHRDANIRALLEKFDDVSHIDYEVPQQLQSVMREYQKTGYKWILALKEFGFGGILADDMGLGKTLQMIAVLLHEKQEFVTKNPDAVPPTSIVVCPASLVYNWVSEIARFAPELKALPISGTRSMRREMIGELGGVDVVITSYNTLQRDISEYEGMLFNFEILDEAQYIKNHNTAVAKTVRALNAAHRFALTGTPIENNLSELWSIYDTIMPGFLYGYTEFRRDFETPIAKNGDEKATERLRRMVAPFYLRRIKSDVLSDLPDKLEEDRYAELEGEQRRLYDAHVARIKQLLSQTDDAAYQQSKLQVLSELTRLRQICCDPSLVYEYSGVSAKREILIELIRDAISGGHRMLVFSQFTSMLSLIEGDLKREGIEYYILTGSTPKQERFEMIERFNSGNTPVFLISLKAGGTGLNLTGADMVIHYDPWWNVAAQNQATDRAHRIGQTRTVTVSRIIARDTIEENIIRLQELKKDLADAILSGENGGFASLSKEELASLLS